MTLGLESFEIRTLMLTTVELTLTLRLRGLLSYSFCNRLCIFPLTNDILAF